MGKRIAITIKPTNDCNMRCRHCYHAEEGFDSTTMKVEDAKKMLKIASQEYDEVYVVFHGGEPTLWGIDNFEEVLNYQQRLLAEKNGLIFKNSIQTNALVLNEKWFELFKKYHFTIGVSFDGPHNDDLRMNTSKVYSNLKSMQKYGLKFGVLCVESALSIKKLKDTYDWFKDEGFNFKILALFMSGSAKDHKEFELDINEYVDSLVEMYKYWLYDKNCSISMRSFEDLLKISDKLYCIQYGGSCIYNRICLNPNGDLYPCGRPYTDDFIIGHIDSLKGISDAFKTPAYVKLATISSERVKQCKQNCEFYGVCKGGCVSSAILEGSFEKIDNITCVRAKRLLGAINEVNKNIYALYDEGSMLEELNPKALRIIKKSRSGGYDYQHCR